MDNLNAPMVTPAVSCHLVNMGVVHSQRQFAVVTTFIVVPMDIHVMSLLERATEV